MILSLPGEDQFLLFLILLVIISLVIVIGPLGWVMCCLRAVSVSFIQSASIGTSLALSHIGLQNPSNSSLVVIVAGVAS